MFPKEWNGVPIPTAITAEWIKNDPEPYRGLEAYVLSLICKAKWGKTIRAVLDELPPGYRLVLRLCELYSDVNNGGFTQFVGNRSTEKRAAEIVETADMLRRFGLHHILKLLRKAIALMGADLPPAVLSLLPKAEREKAARRHLSDEELSRRIRPLDVQFNWMADGEFIPKADDYIKRHPDEFVHQKLSLQRKPLRRHRK